MGVGLMTKQELENAIKNGESVWVVFNEYSYENDSVKEIDWMKVEGVELHNNYFQYFNGEKLRGHYYELIFKTKAEAEHYLHHANVTRTETLPFLTWEDIENYISNMKHFGLNRNDRVLARIITKDSIYYFKLCKDFDLFTFQLKQTYIGEDLCEQIRDKFPVSLGEATEANFYKAYDECVKLFRGGE